MVVTCKPTIPDIVPLIRAYWNKPGNGVGGNFHIVLDDGNWELHHSEWCLERCRTENDVDGIVIGEMLVRMSNTQRKKLSRMNWYQNRVGE